MVMGILYICELKIMIYMDYGTLNNGDIHGQLLDKRTLYGGGVVFKS